jgi:hypothetical protein
VSDGRWLTGLALLGIAGAGLLRGGSRAEVRQGRGAGSPRQDYEILAILDPAFHYLESPGDVLGPSGGSIVFRNHLLKGGRIEWWRLGKLVHPADPYYSDPYYNVERVDVPDVIRFRWMTPAWYRKLEAKTGLPEKDLRRRVRYEDFLVRIDFFRLLCEHDAPRWAKIMSPEEYTKEELIYRFPVLADR